MQDALLSTADRQEALSRAYAAVIAAGAGFTIHPPADFDRDSIDLSIGAGGSMRPRLDVQMKATINLRRSGDVFKFVLRKKNYDDLRVPTMVPRILVVLGLPRRETAWLNVSVRQLVMRRSAYWLSLAGEPELPATQESKMVCIRQTSRFDVDGLKGLMEMARGGAIR